MFILENDLNADGECIERQYHVIGILVWEMINFRILSLTRGMKIERLKLVEAWN